MKNTEISNFMKIRPVGVDLFHADTRTDITKPIATFRNFANAAIKRRYKYVLMFYTCYANYGRKNEVNSAHHELQSSTFLPARNVITHLTARRRNLPEKNNRMDV